MKEQASKEIEGLGIVAKTEEPKQMTLNNFIASTKNAGSSKISMVPKSSTGKKKKKMNMDSDSDDSEDEWLGD